jgi:hypothetical protein
LGAFLQFMKLRWIQEAALATTVDGTGGRRCWKHDLQSTGRPCVGLKGTVVSVAHSEQTVRVSVRTPLPVPATRLILHCLQRFGSFLNCLSWKNSCSPAVKTKSLPQSEHFSILSMKSITRPPEHALEIISVSSTKRRIGIVSPASYLVCNSTSSSHSPNPGNERGNVAKPRFHKFFEECGIAGLSYTAQHGRPALQG